MMKKRCLSILFLGLLTATWAFAQNYTRMWKNVEKARQNDLPRTAIEAVDLIRSAAAASRNVGQYIEATLVRMQLDRSLSSDSIRNGISLLQDALSGETNPASRALFHLVLGRLYAECQVNPGQSDGNDSTVINAMNHYAEAMSRPDVLLQARAADYVPFVVQGKDSRYFRHDLLSVVATEVMRGYKKMRMVEGVDSCRRLVAHTQIEAYRRQGNQTAVLLATLDSLSFEPEVIGLGQLVESSRYRLLTELADKYASEKIGVEVYIKICDLLANQSDCTLRMEWARKGVALYGKSKRTNVLRNAIMQMEQPSVSFRIDGGNVGYPGQAVRLQWQVRNVGSVRLNFYLLPCQTSYLVPEQEQWESYLRKKNQLRSVDTSFVLSTTHTVQELFQDIKLPEAGIYLVQAVSGKVKTPPQLLYVTRMGVMWQNMPGGKCRLAVLDRQSGHPLRGAKVAGYRMSGDTEQHVRTYTTGPDGTVMLPAGNFRYDTEYRVSVSDDAFLPAIRSLGGIVDNGRTIKPDVIQVRLYTDRAVYRPGQDIYFGGIVYRQRDDSLSVLPGQEYVIGLRGASGKQIDTLRICTDSLGSFSGVFHLPSACLNGFYTLSCSGKGSTSIRVEAYKRPTFTVSLQKPGTMYKLGDSVSIAGTVRMYTGVPLQGAMVRYSVKRLPGMRLLRNDETLLTGEAPVGSEGHFVFSILLPEPEQEAVARPLIYGERFEISVSVAGSDGENESSRMVLNARTHVPSLESDWPEKMNRELLAPVTFSWKNTAGVEQKGTGRYRICTKNGKEVLSGLFRLGQPFVPDEVYKLPSGNYSIQAVPDNETDTMASVNRRFVLFSVSDVRPADRFSPMWIYQPSEVPVLDNIPYEVQFGTTEKDVRVFYDLFTSGRLIESHNYTVSDTILRFRYTYKESYGDGVTAVFGFYKDGVPYTTSVYMRKPDPKKDLHLRWTSFRDKLRPGQREEWKLSVLRPDGMPVDASLMATLYDASLDKFASLRWNAALSFNRQLFYTYWAVPYNGVLSGRGEYPVRWLKVKPLVFSYVDWPVFYKNEVPVMVRSLSSLSSKNVAVAQDFYGRKAKNVESMGTDIAESISVVNTAGEAGDEGSENVWLRSDFSETAFFYPQLRTDSKGQVSISFTLPESLTAWNFKALAHDGKMNVGTLDTSVVAVKDFMVQGNLPRFLRRGDETVLMFTIRNLTDKEVSGTVNLELSDAETECLVWKDRKSFGVVSKGQQVISFPVSVPRQIPVLICKVMAEGDGFSDGEQTYLPVLSDRMELTESVPLTLNGAENHVLDISRLFHHNTKKVEKQRLTIEYTARPLWYVVQALPVLGKIETADILSLASAYYAASLAEQIVGVSPRIRELAAQWRKKGNTASQFASALVRNTELKQLLLEETPWVLQAENENSRQKALADYYQVEALSAHLKEYVERLTALQRADGSWSWFKGMPGSVYMTVRVAELLARLEQQQAGRGAKEILDHAMDFLNRHVLKQVEDMRGQEKNGIAVSVDEDLLHYLWITFHRDCSLSSANLKARSFLVEKLSRQIAGQSIYEKALSAIILQKAGREDEARLRVKSLIEYTVVKPETGRFFDTDKAVLSWESYKIPTQVVAIEALRAVYPQKKDLRNEMLQWLLQAKRTQIWGNNRNCVDAVYSLLSEYGIQTGLEPVGLGQETIFDLTTRNGQNTRFVAVSDAETGYFKTTWSVQDDASQPVRLSVLKKDTLPAWGSLYFTYIQPMEQIASSHSGLAITRTYQREVSGRWVSLKAGDKVRKGDLLREVYKMTADRDYDFVCLKVPRPACLEPEVPYSGYTWNSTLGAYRDVKDASTRFFFERFPKGSYVLTIESRVDRSGTFQCGVATIQSVYAPEFSGHTSGSVMEVE